jgi:MoaA/NifB/PqqE/SkfB family radical SAM enzyme
MSQMHGDMDKLDIIPLTKMREILNDFESMGVKAVTYSGGGEPLMHPDIAKILEYTISKGTSRSVITNGQFLNDRVAELLYDADWVRVSIDYCTEAGFVESRRIKGKSFQPILNNIAAFANNKSKRCDLCVNFIITKENHKEIYNAADLLVSLGVENIRFSPMWIDNFIEYHKDIRSWVAGEIQRAKETFETDRFKIYSSYDAVISERDPHFRPYTKCYVMQFNPVIGADLNVYACHNQAYSDDSIICSIKDQSFRRAWFSPEAQAFQDGFKCQKVCTGQCAADEKNIFIHELLDCQGDNFV